MNSIRNIPKYSIIWEFCVAFKFLIFDNISVSGHKFNRNHINRFNSPDLFLADTIFFAIIYREIKIRNGVNMKFILNNEKWLFTIFNYETFVIYLLIIKWWYSLPYVCVKYQINSHINYAIMVAIRVCSSETLQMMYVHRIEFTFNCLQLHLWSRV